MRKDLGLVNESDYYALLCLFSNACYIRSLVWFSIRLAAIGNKLTNEPTDQPTNLSISNARTIDNNKRYTQSFRIDAIPCTLLCMNTHKFWIWLYFKAITRKWKILTNNKAFCLNQLIIRARSKPCSFVRILQLHTHRYIDIEIWADGHGHIFTKHMQWLPLRTMQYIYDVYCWDPVWMNVCLWEWEKERERQKAHHTPPLKRIHNFTMWTIVLVSECMHTIAVNRL